MCHEHFQGQQRGGLDTGGYLYWDQLQVMVAVEALEVTMFSLREVQDSPGMISPQELQF